MYRDEAMEKRLQDRVDGQRLMDNTRQIARWVRLSGSEEEARAVEYIQEKLDEYGLTTNLVHHESYVSWPGPATLRVVSPETWDAEVITHAFGAATDGLEADLVYAGEGMPEDFEGLDVRGKVVLTEGLVRPAKVRAADAAGAAASIHINDENLHEMIVSSVWGHPTPETADELPKSVALAVREPDGAKLKELLRKGPVRVRITAEVNTRWRTLPLLVADLPAADTPEFMLLSGHVDSWHHGAMDNGSANATMMEVARILAGEQAHLRRGLRLAFWSGHSHGRYSGSTWYADNAWDELEQYCVCHINVDSTGAIGANVLTEANVMAETKQLAADAIEPLVNEKFVGTRQSRAGDQSFWGIGLPSVFMSLSQQEADSGKASATFKDLIGEGARGGGLGWWWHTVHDTMDKISEENLVRDTRVYVDVTWRLCADPVLPLDYRETVRELTGLVRDYQEKAEDRIDLSPLVEGFELLQAKVDKLYEEASQIEEDDPAINVVNWTIMQLGRILVPIGYTRSGRFDHDPALPVEPLPGLAPAARLSVMDPDGNEYRFTLTALVRQRNRVLYALREAHAVAEEALEIMGAVF